MGGRRSRGGAQRARRASRLDSDIAAGPRDHGQRRQHRRRLLPRRTGRNIAIVLVIGGLAAVRGVHGRRWLSLGRRSTRSQRAGPRARAVGTAPLRRRRLPLPRHAGGRPAPAPPAAAPRRRPRPRRAARPPRPPAPAAPRRPTTVPPEPLPPARPSARRPRRREPAGPRAQLRAARRRGRSRARARQHRQGTEGWSTRR